MADEPSDMWGYHTKDWDERLGWFKFWGAMPAYKAHSPHSWEQRRDRMMVGSKGPEVTPLHLALTGVRLDFTDVDIAELASRARPDLPNWGLVVRAEPYDGTHARLVLDIGDEADFN